MRFEPILTERLILRPAEPSDAQAAFERCNLPEVAKYQDWELPYTLEKAESRVSALMAMDGPTDGEAWNLTVADAAAPERVLGNLYVGSSWGGRTALVGYKFHPDYWGRGYATEAAQAIIEYMFTDFGVSRIESSAHPENFASHRVMEACGLVYEGLTRQSFWAGTEAHENPYLWRFLIDRMHQRRGVGSAALDLFERRCREKGATAVEVSWLEGPGSPAPIYLARGYEPTGRIDGGEIHAVKRLV